MLRPKRGRERVPQKRRGSAAGAAAAARMPLLRVRFIAAIIAPEPVRVLLVRVAPEAAAAHGVGAALVLLELVARLGRRLKPQRERRLLARERLRLRLRLEEQVCRRTQAGLELELARARDAPREGARAPPRLRQPRLRLLELAPRRARLRAVLSRLRLRQRCRRFLLQNAARTLTLHARARRRLLQPALLLLRLLKLRSDRGECLCCTLESALAFSELPCSRRNLPFQLSFASLRLCASFGVPSSRRIELRREPLERIGGLLHDD
mmetsp:Transcript_6332/g.21203  ORF Transcript_6332/g.21203 Transcript_6332/m.21203 type:complete len:266 (+) Transcript_6332:494-1291(+)